MVVTTTTPRKEAVTSGTGESTGKSKTYRGPSDRKSCRRPTPNPQPQRNLKDRGTVETENFLRDLEVVEKGFHFRDSSTTGDTTRGSLGDGRQETEIHDEKIPVSNDPVVRVGNPYRTVTD